MESADIQFRIHRWLRKQLAVRIVLHLLASMAALAGGLALLLVTYGITFLCLWFIASSWTDLDIIVPQVGAGVFVVLLIIGNARSDREYLTEYSFTTGTVSNEVLNFWLPGVGIVSIKPRPRCGLPLGRAIAACTRH